MYGLKLGGQLVQALSVAFGGIGVVLGIVGMLSTSAVGRGGGAALLGYSLVGILSGILIGGAAQALAVIAENSDYQVRLLSKLAKELPPSNRLMKKEAERVKSEPIHKTLERRAKDF
jgi:hypothetical protein